MPASLSRTTVLLAAAMIAASQPARAEEITESDIRDYSYALGVDLARSLKPVGPYLDIEQLHRGIDDEYAAGNSRLSDQQREQVKARVGELVKARRQAQAAASNEQNRVESARFLEQNARKAGVQVTDSGLQYQIILPGSGKRPKPDSTVTVHYRGELIGGEVFDDSYSRQQPVTFPLGNVIAGWTEGLQLMKVGAKYRFFIPPELAYGDRGAGDRIQPGQALIFEVKLLSIR